jgi:uncharacterized phage protein (TIGR01671 family)
MEDRYLFRAKRIDTGEWIIGSLLVDKQQDIETGEQIEIIGIYPSEYKDFAKKVDPSTVCQCTGLKDKNGKLIWENDIVKINNSKVNTVIAFRDFETICTIPNEKYYKHRLEYDTEYEVIGNVFDNPELLEVQE